MRLEPVEAGAAQDLLPGSLEQGLAKLTEAREKDELAELRAPSGYFFQGDIQEVSDSAFSWHSMQ